MSGITTDNVGRSSGLVKAVAAAGGAWNYISTTTGSSASSVTITGLDSTYDLYMYIITLDGDTDGIQHYMRTEVGGSIISTSSYKYAIMQSYSGSTTPNAYNSASATAIRLNSDGVEADANNPLDIIMYSHNPSNTNYLYKTFQFHGTNKQHDGSLQNWKGSGVYESASAVTGIQIYPASGTYRTYTIRLYGLANS